MMSSPEAEKVRVTGFVKCHNNAAFLSDEVELDGKYMVYMPLGIKFKIIFLNISNFVINDISSTFNVELF